MITVHHLTRSRSLRAVWLLEELGLPYDLVRHQRRMDMTAPGSLKALHPLGKAPLIVDGAVTMFESGAIVEYIIHRYGHGQLAVASHQAGYADYLSWLHAAEGTAMPAIMPLLIGALRGTEVSAAHLATSLAVMRLADDALAATGYFGGNFSAADIMMHTYVALVSQFDAERAALFGRLAAFLTRVQTRPAYLRAVELTEPMVLELPEAR